MKFEGTDHQIIKQESSGALAMYLTPENGGDADFYLYDSDTGKFAPLEVIEVAKGRYIIPLADDGNISLPSQYQKTSLTLNGKEFDTWQDTKNAEYYTVMIQQMVRTRNIRHHQEHLQRQILLSITEKESGEKF